MPWSPPIDEGRVTFLNPIAETITGWSRAEARGKPAGEILRLLDQKTREPIDDPLLRALRDRIAVAAQEPSLLVSRSGAEVPVEHSTSPVREAAGEVRGAILVFRDISKRRQLEEQATHAQKMEAVGRLAGGVAGDFNNVLTVITGYAELLRADSPANSPARRFVDEIIWAGERAAALTRHLLAFSKGPAAQPRVLDLNAVISSMEPMLRRLLGENIDLILLTTPGLGRVKADPAQIEQAIVNLATNSRDAMPSGGKLVIESANVEVDEAGSKNLAVRPGPYVMLAISDTGVGMDPETRSRLFEPFFTTKTPGKGSGLGLSTVYGTIKQSEGQVTVYSQPGCGTIFEVYLPRVKEPVTERPIARSAKGSETILLVDDEEGVRKLVSAVLQSNGYDVLEAANGSAERPGFEPGIELPLYRFSKPAPSATRPSLRTWDCPSQRARRREPKTREPEPGRPEQENRAPPSRDRGPGLLACNNASKDTSSPSEREDARAHPDPRVARQLRVPRRPRRPRLRRRRPPRRSRCWRASPSSPACASRPSSTRTTTAITWAATCARSWTRRAARSSAPAPRPRRSPA